ncbi:hypothetical protein [Actinoplanes sp. NPDC049316]|uniref:hypothetical protein n=1 Tax=Actinoplanes sp. NPDC049316 TaxID=3154727 RepID=UPI003447150A
MSGHAMSPTGVAVVLLLALVVDYMSVGPDSLRDRLAFLLAVPGFRDGFNGSPLDAWTVQRLHDAIGFLLEQTDGAYIAGASINVLIGAGVGILALYTVGCLLPVKAASKLGRFAAMTFPTSAIRRLNWKLWLCAFLLGILADLGRGVIGEATEGAVVALTDLVGPLPILLFGAA